MHAERCPLCLGSTKVAPSGWVPAPKVGGENGTVTAMCHGCNGRGMLIVQDYADHLAAQESAKPNTKRRIWLSPGLAKRLLEDDQQFKGRVVDEGFEVTEIWIGSLCIVDPDAR
jgi:hypothetical protein